jgi:hypothetical protein
MHLRSPYNWDVDAGLRRTIPIHENLKLVIEADCLNVWNHVTFGSPSAGWTKQTVLPAAPAAFGQITGVQASPGPRDFQFAGHLNF